MTTLEKKYQQTMDFIYSYVDFSRTHQEDISPENFDLTRMVQFMSLIQDPHHSYPSIHVAGSKGKGSVSAMCASVYQSSGYRVGLYTSPHLKDFEERIQVSGKPISRSRVVSLVEEIRPAIQAVERITTFEIMTGMAFLYFLQQHVDIAIIEVGLGGRLDATNVVTPIISVITSLYLDHISILGDTLPEIAREKAGIIKEQVPVVTAPQEEDGLAVLKQIAIEKRAPLIEVGKDYLFRFGEADLAGQSFFVAKFGDDVSDPKNEYTIPLLGKYQVTNAATAFAVLDTARDLGFPVTQAQLKKGFQNTIWPARFEIARKDPPIIFDSAHNPASIRKLCETVDDIFPNYPVVTVFGISADKQLGGMYQALLPRTDYLITTQADHPRAMDAKRLLKKAEDYQIPGKVIPTVRDALWEAIKIAGDDMLVLVTGSIFVAASARIAWQEWGKENGL